MAEAPETQPSTKTEQPPSPKPLDVATTEQGPILYTWSRWIGFQKVKFEVVETPSGRHELRWDNGSIVGSYIFDNERLTPKKADRLFPYVACLEACLDP